MLRHLSFITPLLIFCMIPTGGAAQSSHKDGEEVTLSKCWSFPIEDVVGLAADARDLFITAANGRVIAIDTTGGKLWETDLGGQLAPGAQASGGYLDVPTVTGSGAIVWRRLSTQTGVPAEGAAEPPASAQNAELPPKVTARAESAGKAVVGDDHGVVTSLLPDGDTEWRFKTGGGISAVIAAGDAFVVISRDNFVYSLAAGNGGLRWKKRLQGRAAHYGVFGGILVVAAIDQHGASLVELSSGRLVGQLVVGSEDDIAGEPVPLGNGFAVATGAGIQSYSPSGCSTK